MHISRIILNIFLVIALLISSLALIHDSVEGLFLLMTLLLSVKMIFDARFKISNPCVWFVFSINIYHLSICILHYIGFRHVENTSE